MKRKTINYYRDIIGKGFNIAAVKEIIEKYGEGRSIYLGKAVPFHWNHRIEGLFLSREGKVCLDIYWQGDLVDGNSSVAASEVVRDGLAIIPAVHEFVDGRTYERHGDLRVTGVELAEANKALLAYLSPEEVKHRKEMKEWRKLHNKIYDIEHKELYHKYYVSYGTLGENERWRNGVYAVDDYGKAHTKELAKLDREGLGKVVKAVFLANFKPDREFPKGTPINPTCKAPLIYDLSYGIK